MLQNVVNKVASHATSLCIEFGTLPNTEGRTTEARPEVGLTALLR